MTNARATRVAAIVAGVLLAAILLSCLGAALLARRGRAPAFVADVAIWPGLALTVRNGPQGVCHPAARCPRQIGLQPGLSIWLTRHAGGPRADDVSIQRLLFLPAGE